MDKHTFRDEWHHTGDAGRKDEEGYLWFAGRKAEKELIKPGGENVYPVEVEKVILEHPNVHEVSVIGVPDPKFGEGIKAVCALKPKSKLTEQELIDFVAGKIARYKKPGYVQFVDSLPKKQALKNDKTKQIKQDGVVFTLTLPLIGGGAREASPQFLDRLSFPTLYLLLFLFLVFIVDNYPVFLRY